MATPEEARRELARRELARRQQADAPSEQSHPVPLAEVARGNVREAGNLLTGIGKEGKVLLKKAVNLASPGQPFPSEGIKADEASINPDTMEGLGRHIMDIGGTAVPAMGAEMAATKAATTLLPHAGALLRGAGRVGRATGSGALQGALVAPEGAQGAGAGVGGAMSAALSGLGQVGGGLTRSLAKSRISPEAQTALTELRKVDPETIIPASHALKEGPLQQLYAGIVANMPWSGGKLRGQLKDAQETGLVRMFDDATPIQTPRDTVLPKGGKLTDAFESLNEKGDSGGAWDRALSIFNQKTFDTQGLQIPDFVKKALAQSRDFYQNPGQMTGEQLTKLSTKMQAIGEEFIQKFAGGDELRGTAVRNEIEKARSAIDDVLHRGINPQSGGTTPEWDLWKANKDRYGDYKILKSAAQKTPDATPGFKSIAMEAVQKNPEAGVRGAAGPMQELGNLFGDTLKEFPSKQGIFQQAAALGASSGIVGSVMKLLDSSTGRAVIYGTAIPLLVSRGLSSKAAQEAILNGSKTAKGMTALLDKYPELGPALRTATVANVESGE